MHCMTIKDSDSMGHVSVLSSVQSHLLRKVSDKSFVARQQKLIQGLDQTGVG